MPGAKPLTPPLPVGMKFGKLTVIGRSAVRKHRHAYYACTCTCGQHTAANPIAVRKYHLQSGHAQSCGCSRRGKKHNGSGRAGGGLWGAREYKAYYDAKRRCTDPNHFDYCRYGHLPFLYSSYEEFFAEVGTAPAGYSLDRIDNTRGYVPGNCQWASRRRQANNRSTNVVLEVAGHSRTATEWAKEYGLNAHTVRQRIRRGGWPPEKAVTTPVR